MFFKTPKKMFLVVSGWLLESCFSIQRNPSQAEQKYKSVSKVLLQVMLIAGSQQYLLNGNSFEISLDDSDIKITSSLSR